MISHIVYGTSQLVHGNLLFEAWCAGKRGTQVSLEIVRGTPLTIEVSSGVADQVRCLGRGDIRATLPEHTTETQFINALNNSADFNRICLVTLDEDNADGTDEVAVLVQTSLSEPQDGLLQWIEYQLGILGWDDRELIAKDKPVGILWIADTEPTQPQPTMGGPDKWKATVVIGIAFQTNSEAADYQEFIRQNCLADLFRMHLWRATRYFGHKRMNGAMEQVIYGFSNTMKDETTNTVFPNARVRVVGNYIVQYEVPLFVGGDIVPYYDLNEVRIALWRNPITEDPGSPNSHLDAIITNPPRYVDPHDGAE